MAGSDAEIIKRAYEAWNRRDYEAAKEFLDSEVEFDASTRVMNPDTYHGHEGFQRLVEEVAEVWEQWRVEPEEFIEAGEHMVVVARARARGRASGIELDERAFNVWTLRDGKAVRVAFYYDKDEALEYAGSPDAASRA
jgi:ketosteroid isomerase-like protein